MSRYLTLRQLHPIACQVKDTWREDNAVLAIMIVSSDDADYHAQPGDYVSTTAMYDDNGQPLDERYDGTVAIDVYALTDKQYDMVTDHIHFPGDRVLVITGRDILPLDYMDYHCYCAALVRDAYVLDVIDLSVAQPTTEEV